MIARGFHDEERAPIARVYWEAFAAKLGRVLGPDRQALAFLRRALEPSHALLARDGGILGAAGFKTADGAFVGGTARVMVRIYGVSALWRGALASALSRRLEPGTLLIDGIAVDAAARGRGVGTRLLNALSEEARRRGLAHVRLDVSDTNPRAKALYERLGFAALRTHRLGPLSPLFGFASATTMTKPV